ncbi:MAG: PAS domain-containing protein [Rectinemataceae bacterium]
MGPEKKKAILLVEDESPLAMSEKMQLEKCGYGVTTVSSGEKAVEAILGGAAFDLILMDITLGKGIDGTQAAQAILKIHDIPIVFLSSHSEPEVVAKTEKVSSYGYVLKGSPLTVLDASIKVACSLHQAYREIWLKNENLGLALESSRAGTWDWDIANNSFTWSPEFRALFGIQDDTRAGFESWTEAVYPDDREEASRKMQEAIDKGINLRNEYRIMMPGGAIRWIEATGRAYYEEGTPVRMTGLCLDVSERKSIEEELLKSERNLAEAQRIAGIGSWEWDMVSNTTRWSKEMYRIYGFAPETYDGRPETILKIVHPDDVGKFTNSLAGNLKNGSFPTLEYRVIHADGTVHHILANGVVEFGADGQPVRSLGTALDVTAMKASQVALEDSEKRFRSLVWDMDSGVLIQGPHAEILMANPQALELLGLSEDQLLGKTSFDPDWNVIHEDGSPFPGETHPVPKAIATLAPIRDEIMGVFRPTTGNRVWLKVDAIPHMENGMLQHVVCTFTDISKRIQAEGISRSLLSEKSILLKEVHHRIKNNMNNLSSLLSLQAQTVKEPSAITALEDANARLHSMALLYDKLYRSPDYTELSVKDYLPALIEEIVANFPASKLVKVEMAIQEFMLDAKRLQSLGIIINELITNIMKYAFRGRDDGKIAVSATMTGSQVLISVQDDGNGIPESVSFEDSTGFGLQLIQGLTQQLAGTMRIERGMGTKIVLEFEANGQRQEA